ncbi:hypothetical protein BBK36DRAFT_1181391 [Trichoderma citrinoviride]|uniref:Uncharacterized protein n=1 Tax=Trichoderma citrinoviride TaxID=58853 RepID=A0A2T4B471_9HYPO|nr:hypothetical protein BBK36DRAFT_1181391 [Trichoderma citrinoviride]PTB64048.1 hypothetical protein BBK36DRAFT_1181391 [Trichoderma citrinoviride]
MSLDKSIYGSPGRSHVQSFRSSNQSIPDVQLALAGLSGAEEDPRRAVKNFPHRGQDSEEEEKRYQSEPERRRRKSTRRDDDRKGHLDVMLRATEQFLAQGDISKAAKAFAIVLQLRPRAQPIDIRLHNLWSIGSEILMRQREQLQGIDQQYAEPSSSQSAFAGGGSSGKRVAAPCWGSSANLSEIKSYYEILIRQFAYDPKQPNKPSALDFWLALLSCELSTIYAEHLRSIARLEADIRLQNADSAPHDTAMLTSPSTLDFFARRPGYEVGDSGPQYETKEDWVRSRRDAISQRTLTGLRDINHRMEKLMDQPPYSQNEHFLRLREITTLLSRDLTSSSLSSSRFYMAT